MTPYQEGQKYEIVITNMKKTLIGSGMNGEVFLAPYKEGKKYEIVITNMMNKKEKKVDWLTYEWWIFLAPYQEGQKYEIVITNMIYFPEDSVFFYLKKKY